MFAICRRLKQAIEQRYGLTPAESQAAMQGLDKDVCLSLVKWWPSSRGEIMKYIFKSFRKIPENSKDDALLLTTCGAVNGMEICGYDEEEDE